MRAAFALVLLALLSVAPASASAGAKPAWLSVSLRAPERSIVPGAVLTLPEPRREELSAAGHGYVELLHAYHLEIDRQGLVHTVEIQVRHYLTSESVHEHGNVEIGVNAQRERLTIEEAWLLQPNGERHTFDASLLQVVDAAQAVLFSDRKRVVLPFSALQPGSVAVVVSRSVAAPKRFPLPWAQHFYTERHVAIERFEVSCRWSAGDKAPDWKTDDPALACHAEPSRLHCSRDRIPAIQFDPDVRSWRDHIKHLVVSKPQTWKGLAETERAIFEERAGSSLELRALALKLTSGAGSEREKFERLHRYVADDVRYVGLEHGTASVLPRAAHLTLQRGFGDCKDKVTLFLALARAVGLEVFPALVASDNYEPSRMLAPNWLYFDHAIVCMRAETAAAGPLCADLTMPKLPTGLLPPALHGATALLLDGTAEQVLSLPAPRFSLEAEIRIVNELACDGRIHERMQRRLSGPTAWVQHLALQSLDHDLRDRLLAEAYRGLMGDRAQPKFRVTHTADTVTALTIESEADFPASGPASKFTEMYEPEPWLRYYAEQVSSRNQHHSYYQPGLRVASRVTYKLCPALVSTFPGAGLFFQSRFGRLGRTYAREANEVEVVTQLELPARQLNVEELREFGLFLKNSLAQTAIWFGIRSAEGEP